jgi:hypothetical protein
MHRCWPTISPKIASFSQKLTETLYFFVVTPYCGSVIHNSLVYEFLWVFNNFTFSLEMQRCKTTVLMKIASLGQKLIETPYFLVVNPVL